MIMENIRYMLYQYNPKTALYFGHRFAVEFNPNDFSSYMAGGGYILSKKALEKFTKLVQNTTICSGRDNGNEDWEMGKHGFTLNSLRLFKQSTNPRSMFGTICDCSR
jgi:hypothetical protein